MKSPARTVAQRGAVSQGEDARGPDATLRQPSVADREDTAVSLVKPACCESPRDRVVAQAELAELSARDDSVLPRGQLGCDGVEVNLTFAAYIAANVSLVFHRPIVRTESALMGRGR